MRGKVYIHLEVPSLSDVHAMKKSAKLYPGLPLHDFELKYIQKTGIIKRFHTNPEFPQNFVVVQYLWRNTVKDRILRVWGVLPQLE